MTFTKKVIHTYSKMLLLGFKVHIVHISSLENLHPSEFMTDKKDFQSFGCNPDGSLCCKVYEKPMYQSFISKWFLEPQGSTTLILSSIMHWSDPPVKWTASCLLCMNLCLWPHELDASVKECDRMCVHAYVWEYVCMSVCMRENVRVCGKGG